MSLITYWLSAPWSTVSSTAVEAQQKLMKLSSSRTVMKEDLLDFPIFLVLCEMRGTQKCGVHHTYLRCWWVVSGRSVESEKYHSLTKHVINAKVRTLSHLFLEEIQRASRLQEGRTCLIQPACSILLVAATAWHKLESLGRGPNLGIENRVKIPHRLINVVYSFDQIRIIILW